MILALRRIIGGHTLAGVLLLAALCSFLCAPGAHADVLYVKADAARGGDGTSWARAFPDLQDALAKSRTGDRIWVAAGTYYPTADTDREASFKLREGVSVYGGFQGSETELTERDWSRNQTVLSGDIGRKGFADDNSQHVVWGADDAVLDGFVITRGNSTRSRPPRGGRPAAGSAPAARPGAGVNRNGQGPPRGPGQGGRPGGGPIHISPRQILSGPNSGQGAGMINYQTAPTVRNCVFEKNRAAKGGGVYNMVSTNFPPRPGQSDKVPVFINCTFRDNFAQGRGGGVANDLGTAPVFLNCVFEGNETPQKGGGMYNDFGCSPVLINCLFRGNKALSAAAMGNDGSSSPLLYHCTFTKNHADDTGPSLYQGTGPANNPAVINTVVWGNTADWEGSGIYNWHDNIPRVEHSIVEGGYPGASGTDPKLNENAVAAANIGYKPDDPRFIESQLPVLLKSLSAYRPPMSSGPRRGRDPQRQEAEYIPSSQRIVRVSAAAPPNGDGGSWPAAYSSLASALDDAARDGAEVWVAAGVYKPSASDRSVSFALRPGVKLYGGFTGREARRDQRDWRTNATILSGDIGVTGKQEDNSLHVLIGANGAVVDGFTISGGHADGIGYDGKGGGMINYRNAPQQRPSHPDVTGYSPEIRNCTFIDNYARDGGAVYNYDRGKPRFLQCVFTQNRSENGGAVLDRVGVQATYEDCEFTKNTARWRGGAAYFDYGSRPNLKGCTFRDNSTSGHGGAVFSLSRASQLENTDMTFASCRFEGNEAQGNGGAAAFHDSSIATLEQCSFSGNRAGASGGAVAMTSRSSMQANGVTYTNNTSGNEGADVYDDRSGSAPRGARPRPQAPAPGPQPGAAANRPAGFEPGGGFTVMTVGTGAPQYDPERSGPSALVQYQGSYMLVDTGNGAQARLNEAGVPVGRINALMLTHHHLDHIEEFLPLLINVRLRNARVSVIGPPGTKRFVDFIMDFFSEDIAYRLGRGGRTLDDLGQAAVREVSGGESFNLGEVRVTTVRVNHTIHTVAYRFDVDGQSIVISGDLSYSESLSELARDAAVLVIDAGGVIKKNAGAGQRRPQRRQPPAGAGNAPRPVRAHSSLSEVATMAQKAGADRLVLTHITPGQIDEEATLQAIGKIYRGEVIIGHDLLEVSPPKR